jgi:hypothetical protein
VNKDERIIGLTDADFDIVLLCQSAMTEKLQDPEEVKRTRIVELSQVASASAARYTTFRGQITDEH